MQNSNSKDAIQCQATIAANPLLSAGKKIKAYLFFLCSGWRDIEVFGLPKIPKDRKFVNVLITSGDGTIIDICQWFRQGRKIVWQQGGTSNEMYPEYRKVKYWKSMKRTKWWSHLACR